jgi:glycine/D-amino acid oxidase-like deaminating enzyme
MVVIVGAGICGAAAAYYLAKENPSIVGTAGITLIDAVGPAAGSSGKAGAFLTESSWQGTKAKILHEKAFALHKELADELQLDSFRELLSAHFVDFDDETREHNENNNNNEDDSRNNNKLLLQLGGRFGCCSKPMGGRCAQVDPAELTNALLDATIQLGAKLEIDTVENLLCLATAKEDDESSAAAECCIVDSIQLASGKTLSVVDQDVVIALGPWSCRLEDWLGIPTPLDGVLSTSMIWQDAIDDWGLHGNALFSRQDDTHGCHLEVIPRPADRSVYVSGCGGSQVINPAVFRGAGRPTPGAEEPDRSRIPYVRQSLNDLLGSIHEDRDPDEIRACIRPNSPDGIPLVGQLLENCYVATGGGPWGITYGPLMGQSVARMILDDTDNLPIRPSLWSPRRFDTMVYRSLMQQRGQQEA